MPANFIPDPHNGPGHGIISASPFQCETAPTFALINASNKLSLSLEGWQSAEVFLEPTAWDCENDLLRLAVGPQVVDNLDILDMYKLIIKDASGKVSSFNLAIDDIIQSHMAGGDGIGVAAPAAAVVAASMVEPEPEPEPEPQPEPEPAPQPEPLPEVTMPAGEQKKSALPLILGICILCALLGAGLWWYLTQYKDTNADNTAQTEDVDKNKEAEQKKDGADAKNDAAKKDDAQQDASKKPQEPTNPADATDKKDASKGGSATPPPAQGKGDQGTTAPSAQLSPMDSARQLLRQNDTGEKSYDLATNLKPNAVDNADAQDAIFLLLEDAAQKGVSGAMTDLGGYYDPSSTEGKGSIMPDANEARSWYSKAQAGGDAKAEAALKNLRAWAEEESKKGNAAAKELLNSWK